MDWKDPLGNLGPIADHPSPESIVTSELSSAPSDSELWLDLREKVDKLLRLYKPRSRDDDTAMVLKIFLQKLPKDGQTPLMSEIDSINQHDAKLRQLRNFLVDAILKPSKFNLPPTGICVNILDTHSDDDRRQEP